MTFRNLSRREVVVGTIGFGAATSACRLNSAAAQSDLARAKSDLLEQAVAAHGGLDRWKRLSKLTAWATTGGALWALKGQDRARGDARIEIDPHHEHVERYPFLGVAGQHSVFEPDRVSVETDDGQILESRDNPAAAFAGHVRETPWDDLHLVYFNGCAMWTYLTTPFLFKLPGFKTEEIEPWNEQGQEWRRLKVIFPASVASHSAEQIFYFDKNGILCRHDYSVEVVGGAPAANYAFNPKDFGGLVIPTSRRVFARRPDNHPVTDRIMVAIDFYDVHAA